MHNQTDILHVHTSQQLFASLQNTSKNSERDRETVSDRERERERQTDTERDGESPLFL